MTEKNSGAKYTKDQIAACIALLEGLVEDSWQLVHMSREEIAALMKAAGRLSHPDDREVRMRRKAIRRYNRQRVVERSRAARGQTGIRKAREAAVFSAPRQVNSVPVELPPLLQEEQTEKHCYICKKKYRQMHFFYDCICPECGDFNYKKRFQTASLDGRVALITGSRLKIGYQAALMMLRAGARVIATTRFPVDSALRYSKEEDFPVWRNRLHIYGLDLRHTPSVELFCSYVERSYDRLDILINNAAQTVRRPPGFYAHMMPNEQIAHRDLPEGARELLEHFEECKRQLRTCAQPDLAKELALPIRWDGKAPGVGLRASAALSQIPYAYDHGLSAEEVFPAGKLDADLQQVDLRLMNSWRLKLGSIQTAEMLELQLVNAVAPFVLCNRLSNMMKRDTTGCKHIVNVSAMEGKFMRYNKGQRHPHTNMAKAALNMLTHTSASDLAEYGIFMNAVDTGWVTDEDPAAICARKQKEHDFQPPLDIVDGAARVCDPFFDGILTGRHWCGKFLKDYFPIDW